MTTCTDPRKQRIAQVAEMAAKAFAEHELTVKHADGLFRHWRCGRPDSSVYSFGVTTIPGRIIVTGDLGTLVVEREADMIPWCRGAIDSLGYFDEKVVNEIPTREFDYKVALLSLEELANQSPEHKTLCEDLIERTTGGEIDGHTINNELFEEGAIDEPLDTDNWRSRFLWQREAIKWLVDRLPNESAVPHGG